MRAAGVLLDTNVFLKVLFNEEGAEESAALLRRCESRKIGGYVCVVTLSEITTIILREGRQADLESVLCGMREDFSVVSITPEIAVLSGF